MLLDNIAAYLIARGVSTGPTDQNWPLFLSFFSDDQDQMLGVFETGGLPADTLGRENERVTFQVRVRAGRLDYPTCRAKWKQIFDLLQDAQQTAGSPPLLPNVYYIQAAHMGPMMFLDDKGRPNATANFHVMQKRS